jgi:hypothetical protein
MVHIERANQFRPVRVDWTALAVGGGLWESEHGLQDSGKKAAFTPPASDL